MSSDRIAEVGSQTSLRTRLRNRASESPALWRLLLVARCLTEHGEWYIRRALAKVLGDRTDEASMLDGGCGSGWYASYVASRYPDVRIVGIELDPARVAAGTKLAQEMGWDHLVFLEGDLTNFPLQDRFDLILCVHVLEHIEEDVSVLQSFHAAMSDNGHLLVGVPTRPLWFVDHDEDDGVHGREYGHVRDYKPAELIEKVSQAGFVIEEVTITDGFLAVLAHVIWKYFSHSRLFKYTFPIYFGLIHPFVLALMLLDFLMPRKRGQGILVRACKPATQARLSESR